MFELTLSEFKNLRSQIAISSWGGTRYPPFAFSEHGVAMRSSILNSPKAIQTNIAIVKAFIAFRRYALTYDELAQTIKDLEAKFDKEFADINEVLHWLGEENQARFNENQVLQNGEITPKEWAERAWIGFRKEAEKSPPLYLRRIPFNDVESEFIRSRQCKD